MLISRDIESTDINSSMHTVLNTIGSLKSHILFEVKTHEQEAKAGTENRQTTALSTLQAAEQGR